MVRRAKKAAKKKTTTRRTAGKKKAPGKLAERRKAAAANQKAQWVAYKELQAQVDKTWARLKQDIKKKATPQTLIRGKNELLLLLGECNYMANECMRLAAKKKR